MRIAIVLSAALLCACGRQEPVADNVGNTDALPTINTADPRPTGGPPPPEDAVLNDTGPASALIPAALHGRWGLTPADCTSTGGDAKGLLTISGSEMRFYESVAIPGPNMMSSENSIGGNFNFTGEGQSWTAYQGLEVKDGRLTRTQRDPLASFRYVRCD